MRTRTTCGGVWPLPRPQSGAPDGEGYRSRRWLKVPASTPRISVFAPAGLARAALALVAAGALCLVVVELRATSDSPAPQVISGPFALLLGASADLGASRAQSVELTAELHGPGRPDRLVQWADTNGLSVRWRTGDGWAVLQGSPARFATAFRVAIHDYRGRAGQPFYASINSAIFTYSPPPSTVGRALTRTLRASGAMAWATWSHRRFPGALGGRVADDLRHQLRQPEGFGVHVEVGLVVVGCPQGVRRQAVVRNIHRHDRRTLRVIWGVAEDPAEARDRFAQRYRHRGLLRGSRWTGSSPERCGCETRGFGKRSRRSAD